MDAFGESPKIDSGFGDGNGVNHNIPLFSQGKAPWLY
jgi:hypothetical protein